MAKNTRKVSVPSVSENLTEELPVATIEVPVPAKKETKKEAKVPAKKDKGAKKPAKAKKEAKVPTAPAVETRQGNNGGTRYMIAGHTVCQVLKFLGHRGTKRTAARKFLDSLGLVAVSDNTVQCQLNSGSHGDKGVHGRLPQVSEETATTLLAWLNHVSPPVEAAPAK